MGWGRALFDPRGRSSRTRFWLYLAVALPLCAILLVGFWAYALSVPGAYENGGPTPFPTDPPEIAAAIAFFALLALIFVSGIMVSIRRLHDRDKAGWWLLVFLIPPNLLSGAAQYLAETGNTSDIGPLLQLASAAILLWGFVELAMLPGTDGDKRFGPAPPAKSPNPSRKASD